MGGRYVVGGSKCGLSVGGKYCWVKLVSSGIVTRALNGGNTCGNDWSILGFDGGGI